MVQTATVDNQIYNNPSLMHVFSAGNSNNRDCGYGAGNQWGNITGGHKIAKNCMTTANLRLDRTIESSSSRGPTEDGRLKPDIAARGTGHFSTNHNNAYFAFGGTSAAAPGVAGTYALLFQAYREINGGSDPESALLKAALMNTANDMGNPGPDYIFGYGHLNAYKAYKLLEAKNYTEDEIDQGEENDFKIQIAPGLSQLRVMLYWPEAEASLSAQRVIINDLDLVVMGPGGQEYRPLVLDPTPDQAALASPAQPGRDSLNNSEQVVIDLPVAGEYTLRVKGTEVPLSAAPYLLLFHKDETRLDLTYPQGGEKFIANDFMQTHWDAHMPGSDITVEFTMNGGLDWQHLVKLNAEARHHDFNFGNICSENCMIRVYTDRDTAVSGAFSVCSRVRDINVLESCPDGVLINWTPHHAIDTYEVYLLGDKFMEVIGKTTDSFYLLPAVTREAPYYITVGGTSLQGLQVERGIGIEVPAELENCDQAVDLNLDESLLKEEIYVSCGDLQLDLTIHVSNDGENTIDSFIVGYSDGVKTEQTIVKRILNPKDYKSVSLPNFITTDVIGEVNIDLWVDLLDDQYRENDTLRLNFKHFSATSVSTPFAYEEDFETGNMLPANMNVVDEFPEFGWKVADVMGNQALRVQTNSSILVGKTHFLYTPSVDLTGTTKPYLFFKMAYHNHAAP